MNKNLIRICAVLLIISPWIYIDIAYKEAAIIVISIIILVATVSNRKRSVSTVESKIETSQKVQP
jgi:hypothetical protein